jgi:hypothetical protein
LAFAGNIAGIGSLAQGGVFSLAFGQVWHGSGLTGSRRSILIDTKTCSILRPVRY